MASRRSASASSVRAALAQRSMAGSRETRPVGSGAGRRPLGGAAAGGWISGAGHALPTSASSAARRSAAPGCLGRAGDRARLAGPGVPPAGRRPRWVRRTPPTGTRPRHRARRRGCGRGSRARGAPRGRPRTAPGGRRRRRGAGDRRQQGRPHQRSPSRRRIAEPVSGDGGSPMCSATRAAVSAAGSSR